MALIAGWRQWADAGDVSSGLPHYLTQETRAARIGTLDAPDCYLFQMPGTHHLLRPVVRLADGHRVELGQPENEFFLAAAGGQEFIVFLGTEPHRNEYQYSDAFLDAVRVMGVQTVAVVAGVHGAVPHWRERRVSSVYSTPPLKTRLERLNVRFSAYEGGATIGMYLAARASGRNVSLCRLCAYVPTYTFSAGSTIVHRMAMDEDFVAWHGLMRRLNRLLGLTLDLSDLASRGEALTSAWNDQIDELSTSLPRLRVHEYLERVEDEFDAEGSDDDDDLWAAALRDIVDGSP
jgi:proteasome assembly chaperone (PAC2) family protein